MKESVKAHPILNYSNTLKLLSYFYVNSSIIKTQFKLAQLKSEIKEQKDAIFAQTQSLSNPPTLDFESVGPSLLIEGDNDAVSFILDYYLKSSNQLENLLKSENVLYFHFLQPNLHYQDSRKTTPQEDRDKINQIGPYSPFSKKHYKRLEDKFLEQKFRTSPNSLTAIFTDVDEPIYSDNCCHYNQTGNEVIAGAIIKNIIDEMR